MTRFRAALCLAFLLLLASCGGKGDAELRLGHSAGPDIAAQSSLPKLPPVQAFNPARITAAFETTRLGSQAEETGPNVTLGAGFADFAPLAQQLSWAIYRFDGVPDDVATDLSFTLSNVTTGSRAWIAVSDYDQQAWSFLPPQTASATLPLSFAPGQLTSPSGQVYVAVMAFSSDKFRLLNLGLTFGNRHSVSGQVLDELGNPIAAALVTTTLDDNGVLTDAAGNFTLPTIPNGTWHLMATKDSHVFFANPLEVTVSGAPVSGIQFTGYDNESHFTGQQGPEPNNIEADAVDKEIAGTIIDSLSAIDDRIDHFRVNFEAPGNYILKCRAGSSILFPDIRVYTNDANEGYESPWGMHGAVYVGIAIAEAPAQRLIRVECQGGGGTYSISFENGLLARLEGDVRNLAESEYQAFSRIDISDGQEDSFIYSRFLSPSYSVLLPPTGVYIVSASDPDYSFVPPSASPNLAAGDQLDVDFEGTAVDISDQFEPNDDFAGATALTLPVDIPVGDLSIGRFDDYDYYKVTPTAGKFLRAVLTLRGGAGPIGDNQIQIDILDEAEQYVSGFCQRPDAWESRTTQACTNDPYYITIGTTLPRKFAYGLRIEEFDGTTINVLAQFEGQPLQGVRIDNYILPQGLREQQCRYTDDTGSTNLCLGVMQGETVYLEAFRYGMEFDRHTQMATATAAPVNVTFNATAAGSLDFAEPNESDSPFAVTVPLDLTATVDDDTDLSDGYLLDSSGEMLKLSWDALLNDGTLVLYLDVYDQDELYIGTGYGSSGSFVFPSGTVSTRVEIFGDRGRGRYNIKLEPVQAYYIGGQIIDDQPTEDGMAGIRVVGSDLLFEMLGPDEYRIGPLEPGDYTLECYAVNYDFSADSPAQVTITNADVIQDFNLTYDYGDSGEPNNDKPTATVLADNTPFVANLDSTNPIDGDDAEDWYRFDTSGPGLVKITVQQPAAWFSSIELEVFDSADDSVWDTSRALANGNLEADFYLPVAGTYYVQLGSGDQDYVLQVNYP